MTKSLPCQPEIQTTISFIESAFNEICQSYGFKKLYPDTIATYKRTKDIDKVKNNNAIKFINPDGDVMTMIADPTISASAFINSTNKYDNKIFYFMKTYNYAMESEMETIKGGVEYYSKPSPINDAEIINLAMKYLDKLDLKGYRLEIGNVKFLEAMLSELNLDKKVEAKIEDFVHEKNSVELEKLLNELPLESNVKDAFTRLPFLFGKPEEIIQTAKQLSFNKAMDEVIEYLEKLYSVLEIYNLTDSIKLDLSFTNKYAYYTGLIFKGYSIAHGDVLISGGRYSIKNGSELTGCGFGFDVKTINEVINMKATMNSYYDSDFKVIYYENDLKDVIVFTEYLREQGFKVSKVLIEDSKERLELLKTSKAKEVIEFSQDNLQIFSAIENNSYKKSLETFKAQIEENMKGYSIH